MMKKIGIVKKLWLAALLVLVLGAMLCVVASARIYSGTCGADFDNLTWTFDDSTGELVISGIGKMTEYMSEDAAPWKYIDGTIKNVTIEEGVTSIGQYAFAGCELKSVSIPDSVTSIGGRAFYCSGLKSVIIHGGVTKIDEGAFGWSGLESVTISEGVTSISAYMFEWCDNLTNVTIPASMTSIGSGAFSECLALDSVTVLSKNVEIYDWSETISDTATIYGYAGSTAEAYAEKYDRTFVALHEHSYSDLLSYDETNHWYTCSGCDEKKDMAVHSYDNNCDTTCDCSYVRVAPHSYAVTLNYDESGHWYACLICGTKKGTSSHGYDSDIDATCNACDYIRDLIYSGTCGSNGDNLTWMLDVMTGELIISGTGAMADYSIALSTPAPWYSYRSSIKTITIGDDVTSIGKYAFYGCSEISDITIPKGIASIGTEALSRCEKLEAITVAEDNVVYHSAGNCLIETEAGLLVAGCNTSVIPTDGSVTAIGGWAFFGCTGLDAIIIPDSVTSIGTAAFQTCTALKSIRIPESVTLISQEAFNSCSALSEFVILSKTVEIADDEDNFFTIPKNATIYGYEGSTAEVYAADYGRRFVTLGETEELSMISYQVTKGEGGEFSLRLISGLNSLNYSYFGYEVTVTTKDAEGHDVVKTVSGKSNKVYTSVYGGSTAYAIKEHFGYEYAALATVTGLAVDSEYVKLDIRTYVYVDGARLYGGGAVLTYTGTAGGDGYPALSFEAK